MLLLSFLVLGLLIGYLQGGSSNSLSLINIRHGVLVVGALAIQMALYIAGLLSGGFGAGIELAAQIVSYALVISFLLLNRQIRRVSLIAAGLALNLTAILANGGYISDKPIAFASTDANMIVNAVTSASTSLWFLGDVLSFPNGILGGGYFSAGDLLIALGLFIISREIVLARAMRPQIAGVRYRPKHLMRSIQK